MTFTSMAWLKFYKVINNIKLKVDRKMLFFYVPNHMTYLRSSQKAVDADDVDEV